MAKHVNKENPLLQISGQFIGGCVPNSALLSPFLQIKTQIEIDEQSRKGIKLTINIAKKG